MSNSANPSARRGLPPAWRHLLGLLARLLLAVTAGTALAWGWLYLFYYTPFARTGFYRVSVSLILGLSAGLSARLFLRRNTAALRWLTVALNAAAGLPFMYFGTRGLIGFWLFGGVYSKPNWDGLWQLGLAIAAGWGILLIRARKPAREAAAAIPQTTTTVVQPRITSRKGKAKAAASQVSASKAAAAAPRQRKTKPLKEAAANIASSLNKPVEKPARQKSRKTASPQAAILRVKKPRKQTRQASGETLKPRIGRKRRATISLVGKEEHRCPFCLEEVNPRDPAGVVTCPICHTMHHKSCWDVTGTCQVPHSQS